MQRPRELTSSLSMYPALTPTLLPATHTNSFALGGRDVLLVEPATPYADEQKEWLAWARSLASQGRTPIAIFATHHHADHTGGLDVLSRELDLPVWAHELTAKRLTPALQERITRRLTDEERIVLEGPHAESWRVLHTPGHAPGHLCLFEEGSRAAVVGDMVAGVGTILIAPGDGDMQLYLQQLDRLAELNASVALPAHGDPIDEPTKLFRFYISHRLAREAKVLAAVEKAGAAGADSAALVPEAYADTPPHIWPIAKLSLEMHLEKLVREGKVAMDGATARARGSLIVWERSFVGVSVLLGATAEDATSLLADAQPPSHLDARLRDNRRAVRAQALAVVAQEIAVALGEITLR